jgi:hypothetical protein
MRKASSWISFRELKWVELSDRNGSGMDVRRMQVSSSDAQYDKPAQSL